MSADLFRKQKFRVAVTACSLALSYSYADAQASTVEGQSVTGQPYVGVFGGGGDASKKTDVEQRGVAFNNPAGNALLALQVDAHGHSGKFGGWLAGAHFGYEFASGICLIPALELEGYYFRSTKGERTGFITNNTIAEHDFLDTLPFRAGVFVGEFILALRAPSTAKLHWLEPYVGGGIGGAVTWIDHAKSEQNSPAEPGINHFNSDSSASDGAFVGQFKAGVRFNFLSHWRLFAEYRYLHIPKTRYTFGFTQYSTHAPTSHWILNLGKLNFNFGVVGLDYKF